MTDEEIESLCRGGKSYAVAEAILDDALQNCENIVEGVKKAAPRILADKLKRNNEQLNKLIGK